MDPLMDPLMKPLMDAVQTLPWMEQIMADGTVLQCKSEANLNMKIGLQKSDGMHTLCCIRRYHYVRNSTC